MPRQVHRHIKTEIQLALSIFMWQPNYWEGGVSWCGRNNVNITLGYVLCANLLPPDNYWFIRQCQNKHAMGCETLTGYTYCSYGIHENIVRFDWEGMRQV